MIEAVIPCLRSESSSSLKNSIFVSDSDTLLASDSETECLTETGLLSLSPEVSPEMSPEVDSVSSEPQNLLAKEEDLNGADLHLVNSKAFLGGVLEMEAKGMLSQVLTLSSSSSSSQDLP